ncbi:hypothetical protein CsSME_00044931 [Camellia sinensis var. sinensis]
MLFHFGLDTMRNTLCLNLAICLLTQGFHYYSQSSNILF